MNRKTDKERGRVHLIADVRIKDKLRRVAKECGVPMQLVTNLFIEDGVLRYDEEKKLPKPNWSK